MNRESARALQENSIKSETISFERLPHQSKLFLDFQADAPEIDAFYPEKRTSLKGFAAKVLADYKIDREKLCDALEKINRNFNVDEKTLENIDLLRQKDCLAIVTGQQAGLFSGSLYTIYKALSAVRLCEELRKQNIKTVPVFWIAEEDHDFDEVKKTFVLDKDGKLTEIENTPRSYQNNWPVGRIELDETIDETLENIASLLAPTAFSSEVKKILSESYRSGENFSVAFARFLARIFEGYGLIFLAPLDDELKNLSAPIFAEALENSDQIVDALLERNERLKKSSYAPQVLVEENSFPFFYIDENGERLALRRDTKSGEVRAQNSKIRFEKSELRQLAEKSPGSLSPNALLRPVVQDYLLPTLTYFGGAAEIAYFAQNSVIYEILSRPLTPIRHRASLTIVGAAHRRTLEKYELEFADLFAGKNEILAKVVEKFLGRETARVFAEVEETVNTQLNRLDRHLNESEPTLSDNLANRRRKILWHIGALRKKYHRAEIFKNEVVHRRIETLFETILPQAVLQERNVNALTFINLYGRNFIEWVYNAIEADEKNHRILYL